MRPLIGRISGGRTDNATLAQVHKFFEAFEVKERSIIAFS